jgi:hypothetical protein
LSRNAPRVGIALATCSLLAGCRWPGFPKLTVREMSAVRFSFKRQDDLAILVPLVGAAEQVADAPDEVGDLEMSFSGHALYS